ncbi:hypothetical protein VMCG_05872 [Cytospora schulzeri]|uniref:Apple domain-containing protein n=1 Tax=Cytospora schulzeri TaxID=448051 RepID=A0A423WD94_9PEZI|nr:hypothetical protein VMCG_05872 [Valsa malicola]
MQSKYFAAVPLLAGGALAQTSVPTCGFTGWDTGVNIGYYGSSSYATYSACSALCDANTACLSFSYNAAAPDCILYDYAVEGNDVADPSSPNTFFDRGAYYADAASATYSGCLALCNANSACLSFGLTSAPACILYNYTIEGNDVADASSGNTFYDRGGACPTTTSTTSTTTSSTAIPTQTGAFANCPSGLVPYDINSLVTPYSPCNSSYPSSACMSDIDGSAYCNLCLACTTTTCASDADCGVGYACIQNSDCAVNGETNGTAVCLYMLAGGAAFGCYDSPA